MKPHDAASLARAFKAVYGLSPGRYRESGAHAPYRESAATPDGPGARVEVRDEPGYRCVGVPHTGGYMAVDRAFSELYGRLERAGVPLRSVRPLGVYFDYDALEDAYGWLFGRWLPESGREPADAPAYELYLNDPRDTPPMELRVDICLPLAPFAASAA